ncbi:adenine nucleotide alpha hydrolase ATP-binding family protein [Treponema primitia ZAS-2]|uniref:Adenine nucleotide alpha hydrolase ATP-binding family protein n=1 Tax=Treponema primitia (strain ATCC BAA-887 / DSM 12427 / ZAS-2) TaxID=545694 RepID=F5YKS0_TREPZ|nr:tRNA 2-thiocytidine biosynthesis TtcA family protein [Treponema primitia]AEF84174.1 adenine nucleotide alpha hydrolase ATP-binding family protein [Treponema primitia ZAS-2]
MANRFLRTARADTVVQKLTAKAILERNLIAEGDRILIAASGGKDSTVMAWALSALKPALKRDYELEAIHISSDFCACCKKSALSQQLAGWGIPFTDLFVPVIGRLKEGEKMNCYWCSTQRRTELLKYAVENNFNKIALGHHLDDIIETFFMNMTAKGELSTMPMLLSYRKYPVSLIRPLGYLEEQQIIACAAEKDILKAVCTCPYGINSKRRDMRKRIAEFTGNSGAMKRRMLKALSTGEKALSAEKE